MGFFFIMETSQFISTLILYLHCYSYFVYYKIFRVTIEFCKRAEKAGASFISVHGRTKSQRNEPIDLEAIKLIKENLSIPVVGNGDIFHLNDALKLQEATSVNGKYIFSGTFA